MPTIQLLLEHLASVDVRDKDGRTLLFHSAGGNVTRLLLEKKVDVTARQVLGDPGATALHYAAKRGDLGAMKALLAANADPSAATTASAAAGQQKGPYGQTALFFAASGGLPPPHSTGQHKDAVALLLEHKADPNHLDCYGQTPLFYAAKNGDVPLIKALVEAGGQVDVADSLRQETCLFYAVNKGRFAACKYLILAAV